MKAAIRSVLVAASLLLAAEACAQPSFHDELSIEAFVLNADGVVVGRIVGVKEGKKFHELTIIVDETLRGHHRARQSVRFRHEIWRLGVGYHTAASLSKWQDESRKLLLAFEGEEKPLLCGLINLTAGDLRVFKADLTTLHKAEDVLTAAREALRRMSAVKKIDTFALTVAIEGGYFGKPGSTSVTAPADERLEQRLQGYVRSKLAWQRAEGAEGLRYFKSDENIARLKTLLNDPESHVERRAEDNGGIEVRTFRVRAAAFDTLRYWGVIVEKPVLREEGAKAKR